ncbi:50S ribosomal protein L4 [Patescibacteria group bacterium]|nr:50S ribosomal protein L4 [Patescibacteria group bacterium]
MKVKVLDTKAEVIEEITLSDDVFGIEPNDTLLAQYVRVFSINQRQGTSSTKTRAEVSGGGKKPWRQKGTGRARHGSIRSPIWVGGGIAHGPRPYKPNLKMPKRMRVLAFKSALSYKFKDKKVTILDKVKFEKPSTKTMVEILKKLKIESSALLVWFKKDENLVKSASNILSLNTKFAGSLNTYDLLKSDNIIFIKDAVLDIEKKYLGKKEGNKDEDK